MRRSITRREAVESQELIVRDAKIWTNSSRAKDRSDEELRRRKTVIHSEGTGWDDDTEAKPKEYKAGRAVG